MSSDKYRYWWFIAYPDSLPDDWIDILSDTLTPIIISPLHEFDLDKNGNFKKPHYHIIVIYNGPTTFNHIKKHFCDPLNATIPKYVLNLKGAFDYLTHKNNADKYPYDEDSLQWLNGANYGYIDIEEDNFSNIRTVLSIISDNKIRTFRDLVNTVKDDDVLLNVVRINVFFLSNYLK